LLVLVTVFLVVCVAQVSLGYVPWAAIACLTALYLMSPLGFVLLLLAGGAVLFFARRK